MKYKYKPYSYSKIALFKKCPCKFKYQYILSNVYEDFTNIHMDKGKFFHYVLEHYPNIVKKYTFKYSENECNLHNYLSQIKELISNDEYLRKILKEYKIKSEFKFYLDENLNKCNKQEAIVKGFIDYIGQEKKGELILIDWKTGKSKASIEQFKIYVIWAFSAFTNINDIKCIFYYVEQNCKEEFNFNRKELPKLKYELINQINKIEKEINFDIKRNKYCQYCEFFSKCKPYTIKINKKGKENG